MSDIKVLFISSEVAPFAKTGGLADVVGVLPETLNRIGGIDARVILPLYRRIRENYSEELEFVRWSMIRMGWRSLYAGLFRLVKNDTTYYFIDNEYYFGFHDIYKEYSFDIERFCFFQRAVLECLGSPMDFEPDILHCNDWQSGLIPTLLEAHYRPYGFHNNMRTIFTIHNLRYQGIHGVERIADLCDLSPAFMNEYGVLMDGVPNMMKAGIVYADMVTTVSPNYANEIMTDYYGEGLNGVLANYSYKLRGILNGIDVETYNPETDSHIAQNYTLDSYLEGKKANKNQLQSELSLPVNDEIPLVSMITRLTDQKGLDLFLYIADELMQEDIQCVILGTGEAQYEEALRALEGRYPDKVRALIYFGGEMSHKIYAGADIFLMPSLFEPCGLSQMISMRYGTVPVVRETGGLSDTVQAYNMYTGEGNGFSFTNINAHELLFTTKRAIEYYLKRGEDPAWKNLVTTGMETDFSWTKSGHSYIELYRQVMGLEEENI